jgi:hypothetical protein
MLPLHWPTDYSWQTWEHNLMTGIIPSHHTIEDDVALGHLSGGARLPGRVIHFGVDCLSPLSTGSLVENLAPIGQAYPMLE